MNTSRSKREPKPTKRFLNFCSIDNSDKTEKHLPVRNTIIRKKKMSNNLKSVISSESNEPNDHDSSMDTGSSSLDIRRSSRKSKPSSKLDGFVSSIPKKVEKKVATVKPIASIIPTASFVRKVSSLKPSVSNASLSASSSASLIKKVSALKCIPVSVVTKPTVSSLAKTRSVKRSAEQADNEPRIKVRKIDHDPALRNAAANQFPLVRRRIMMTKQNEQMLKKRGTSPPPKRRNPPPIKRRTPPAIKRRTPPAIKRREEKVILRRQEKPEEGAEISDSRETLEKFYLMGSKVSDAIEETLDNNEGQLMCLASTFERKCQDIVSTLAMSCEDISERDLAKVFALLDSERMERKKYRETFVGLLRVSNDTNLTLYTQMLRLLETV